MKKIMIALGAVVIAASVQAAAITWKLTGITNSEANTAGAGMVAYFLDSSTYDAFSALTADKVADYVMSKYTYTGTTTKNARTGAVALGVTSGNYDPLASVSGYVVLFDTADASAAKYYVSTGVVTGSIPASGATTALDFGTVASNGGWQTTAVPEPTSGLLMLLGMAGLALRRRRA